MAPDRHTRVVEIEHAVRHEMARTLEDVVFRRTGLGTIGHPGREALLRCAAIMADHLGWDEDEQARQIAAVEDRYRYR